MNENDTPNENDAQKNPTATEKPLFPARTFPAVYLLPGDPPTPPMQMTEEQQRTLDKIKADAAAASERAGAGIEAAFEKAAELDKLFVRFSEMAATPKERTEIDRFLESMRRGETGLGLAYDALLLGARFGRDPAKDAEIQQSQKRIEAKLDHITANQEKTMPYLAGVPPVVEQANENKREGMGELYRVLYAPGFTPKQKAIADAMRETGNRVRKASEILKRDKWPGTSPGRISVELAKMDKQFADAKMTNPFASREHNRRRPVMETTYRKRKVDSDDPDSAVEIVPNRPGGYHLDET